MHKILRSFIFLFTITIGFLMAMPAIGQSRIGQVKGFVTDSLTGKPLANATINILDGKDSSLVSFARSKENGSFEINKLATGEFILLISYTGFKKDTKKVIITPEVPVIDFGSVKMSGNSTLEDVTVVASPVMIKGDTVEFNAASFKVAKPNAVVEDLLKRLPGVEVDKDGNIKANGQDVKRVLVDGKEFFGNDPKLATRNLQADMVKKVQVFDKKSDQSQFTGFDDGNTEPTINLTLKEDKRNGVFGKVSGGAGTDGHYQANANVNKFKKGEQLSFIGQANDINQQGFSLMDALSFGGGGAAGGRGGGGMSTGGAAVQGFGNQAQGITTTQAAGLNYNNFKNSKVEVTSSYFFNGTQVDNNSVKRSTTTISDSTQVYGETGTSGRDNYNHRVNLGVDWKMDSFNSIKISPSFSYQTTETFSNTVFGTTGPKGTTLSNGTNKITSNSEGYNLNVNALYRHKFAKAGRTFSTELRLGHNESDGDGTQQSVNNNYVRGISIARDQVNYTDADQSSLGVTARYTEPMSRRSLLEFSAFHNQNANNNNKRTFDYNTISGSYDLPNDSLTNLIDNDYMTSGGGLKYRENREGWNYTIGADLQRAELSSLIEGKNSPISQSFLNVLPNLQLQIGKNRYRNFRLIYNGTTQNPSISQLQPIDDISNQPNIVRGNPNLKQSFINNVRINYNTFDPYTMKSFFLNGSIRQTNNAIVNSDSMFKSGGRLTTYENVDGVYASNLNGNVGFPIKFGETKASINLGTGVAYNHNKEILNLEENKINVFTLSQRVSGSYMFKELFDVTIGGTVKWDNRTYSKQETQNTSYIDYTADLDLNFYLPMGFTLGNTVAYNANTGRGKGFDVSYTLWNAYLAKSVLKNKRGEFRLTAFDLLNQNTGNSRVANGNSIEDTRYLVLKQYFMLTFTYNLSMFGNVGNKGGQGQRMMMMGMPR